MGSNNVRKNPDQDHLNHSVYVCADTQQMVKISWSTFYQAWRIEGTTHKNFMDGFAPYFIHTSDLSRSMQFPDQYMETYFTPCQEKGLNSLIESTLVEVFSREKQY